jgi:hypothetical protein
VTFENEEVQKFIKDFKILVFMVLLLLVGKNDCPFFRGSRKVTFLDQKPDSLQAISII